MSLKDWFYDTHDELRTWVSVALAELALIFVMLALIFLAYIGYYYL